MIVFGVRRLKSQLWSSASRSALGIQASSAFPTLVECKNMRRPTQVFTLKNPGASTFSM